MVKNSKKQDSRGRSPGSRTTQFSAAKQPDRSTCRKSKVGPDVVEMMRNAIYEKVPGHKDGRRVKIPFIEAFIYSMRKKAFSGNMSDQLKFFKELVDLGIFEIEDFRQKLFNGINNHYKKMVKSYGELTDFLEKIGIEYKRVALLYQFYFIAFATARQHCTCGACSRGLDHAEFLIPILLRAAFAPEDGDGDEFEAEESAGGEDILSENSTASESGEVMLGNTRSTHTRTDDNPDRELPRGLDWH